MICLCLSICHICFRKSVRKSQKQPETPYKICSPPHQTKYIAALFGSLFWQCKITQEMFTFCWQTQNIRVFTKTKRSGSNKSVTSKAPSYATSLHDSLPSWLLSLCFKDFICHSSVLVGDFKMWMASLHSPEINTKPREKIRRWKKATTLSRKIDVLSLKRRGDFFVDQTSRRLDFVFFCFKNPQ